MSAEPTACEAAPIFAPVSVCRPSRNAAPALPLPTSEPQNAICACAARWSAQAATLPLCALSVAALIVLLPSSIAPGVPSVRNCSPWTLLRPANALVT